MIYKNSSFGETKYYMISSDFWGHTEVIEMANGIERTRLSMNADQADNFIKMLESNNWQKDE